MSFTLMATYQKAQLIFSYLQKQKTKFNYVKQGMDHTKSIPMVSWIPVSNASFSLVPTPSVPATRYESPVQENIEVKSEIGNVLGNIH